MAFALDIAKFVNKCNTNADLTVRRVVMDVGKSLMEYTPVGNPAKWKGWGEGGAAKNPEHWLVKAGFVGEGYTGGHARANWQLNIGSIPTGVIDGTDKEGRRTLATAYGRIPKKAAGKVFFWGNNVPYAQRLEDGYSRQAPHGMVGLTVREFQKFIRNALRELP